LPGFIRFYLICTSDNGKGAAVQDENLSECISEGRLYEGNEQVKMPHKLKEQERDAAAAAAMLPPEAFYS